jgi:hypothetical protein
MNIRIFICCLFLISTTVSTVSATAWLSGLVTDENNEPLAGAFVLLDDQTFTCTDADGYYLIRAVPGQRTLRFNFMGYDTLQINGIQLAPACVRQTDVQLIQAPVRLGEVCISAYKVPLIKPDVIYCGGSVKSTSGCLMGSPQVERSINNADKIAGDATAIFRATLFPNPADTYTRLELDSPALSVEIFDQSGVLVRTFYHLSAGVHTIPVQDFPAGAYTVRIGRNDNTRALRLVVAHD